MAKLSKSKTPSYTATDDDGATLELEPDEVKAGKILLTVGDGSVDQDGEPYWSCIYVTPEQLAEMAALARKWVPADNGCETCGVGTFGRYCRECSPG